MLIHASRELALKKKGKKKNILEVEQKDTLFKPRSTSGAGQRGSARSDGMQYLGHSSASMSEQ